MSYFQMMVHLVCVYFSKENLNEYLWSSLFYIYKGLTLDRFSQVEYEAKR